MSRMTSTIISRIFLLINNYTRRDCFLFAFNGTYSRSKTDHITSNDIHDFKGNKATNIIEINNQLA